MAISMDADLQDDINACDEMIEKYGQGFDIVYGVRSARNTDSFFKRTTALGFYKLMDRLGANTVYNHADYRLMSRRALEGLSEFGEVNLFLRGIVPMIGYPSTVVYYERAERFAGESKYPLKKMISFAVEDHYFSCQYRNPDLFPDPARDWRDCCRLDFPCRICLGDRRSDPARSWCHRRVYRKDLPGDQEKTALHYRAVS